MWWSDRRAKKIQNSEQRKAELKRERQEEIKAAIKEELAPIKKKQEEMDDSLELLKDGNKCSLRDRLLYSYKMCSEQGYRTTEETQNWEKMYDVYDKLKGNSFVHDLKNQFESIDTYEEYKAKENKRNAKEGRK